jgi:hypothetical protein
MKVAPFHSTRPGETVHHDNDKCTEGLIVALRRWVQSRCQSDVVPIKGLWTFDCIYQPEPKERKFVYQILVAQTTSQGACYYLGTPIPQEHLVSLVGEVYDFSPFPFPALEIALLDSVAASTPSNPDLELWLAGPSPQKAQQRARIIASEVNRLAMLRVVQRPLRVCNVGLVSLLALELLSEGFDVIATDMQSDVVGKKLFDRVPVYHSDDTCRLVTESDIAVVTGMTLSTNTLRSILDAARASGTAVVMFAQTGAGFAPFYLANGVSSVISEPFPFYIFEGTTCIRVFRAPSACAV